MSPGSSEHPAPSSLRARVLPDRIKYRTSIHDRPAEVEDRYSAWQRGANEHFNGRISKYLPKGTSFHDLTQAELNEFITEINDRPRKNPRLATPAEVFNELCSNPATPNRCTSN